VTTLRQGQNRVKHPGRLRRVAPHRDITVHSRPKIGQLSQKIARKEQCDARYAGRDRPDPEYAWGLGKAEGET
jgi:hypothetical protein